jgi:hypothetical protein
MNERYVMSGGMKCGVLAKEWSRLNLPLKVLQSNAGFYIGTFDDCGPVSRESVEYYPTESAAQNALDKEMWSQRSHP